MNDIIEEIESMIDNSETTKQLVITHKLLMKFDMELNQDTYVYLLSKIWDKYNKFTYND